MEEMRILLELFGICSMLFLWNYANHHKRNS